MFTAPLGNGPTAKPTKKGLLQKQNQSTFDTLFFFSSPSSVLQRYCSVFSALGHIAHRWDDRRSFVCFMCQRKKVFFIYGEFAFLFSSSLEHLNRMRDAVFACFVFLSLSCARKINCDLAAHSLLRGKLGLE